jgi:hypothetical protein
MREHFLSCDECFKVYTQWLELINLINEDTLASAVGRYVSAEEFEEEDKYKGGGSGQVIKGKPIPKSKMPWLFERKTPTPQELRILAKNNHKLAMSHFKKGELDKAKFHIDLASNFDPANKKIETDKVKIYEKLKGKKA